MPEQEIITSFYYSSVYCTTFSYYCCDNERDFIRVSFNCFQSLCWPLSPQKCSPTILLHEPSRQGPLTQLSGKSAATERDMEQSHRHELNKRYLIMFFFVFFPFWLKKMYINKNYITN